MAEELVPIELLPCPHCEAAGYFVWNRTQSRGAVKCTRPSCGAAGGAFEQRNVAIAAWNTRATPDLAAAHEAGRREGLEIAAQVADDEYDERRNVSSNLTCRKLAALIRAKKGEAGRG